MSIAHFYDEPNGNFNVPGASFNFYPLEDGDAVFNVQNHAMTVNALSVDTDTIAVNVKGNFSTQATENSDSTFIIKDQAGDDIFSIDTENGLVISSYSIQPVTNATINLGSNALAWNNVYGANAYTTTSDLRAKKNVEAVKYGLEVVRDLKPAKWNWINEEFGTQDNYGFVYQEVEETLKKHGIENCGLLAPNPDAIEPVHDDFDESQSEPFEPFGYHGMRLTDLLPFLVNAIKELDNKNKSLEERLGKLEKLVK